MHTQRSDQRCALPSPPSEQGTTCTQREVISAVRSPPLRQSSALLAHTREKRSAPCVTLPSVRAGHYLHTQERSDQPCASPSPPSEQSTTCTHKREVSSPVRPPPLRQSRALIAQKERSEQRSASSPHQRNTGNARVGPRNSHNNNI